MTIDWTPHAYQMRGIEEMLAKPGYGLFAEPGLGKTSTALAAFSVLTENKAARGLLVVAPLRPCYRVWPSEIAKWTDFAGMSCVVLHGPKKAQRLRTKADVYVINYEGLAWLQQELAGMKEWPFDVLCLDESTKIKNTKTQRYKIVKALRDRFSRVWILTGTPAPNGIQNLFGQIFMLDGGERLGKYVTHFNREYFYEERHRMGFSLWHARPDTQERVQRKISDITLALKAEDYLKMPRRIDNRIEIELPASVRGVYKDLEDEFYSAIGSGVVTAANAAAKGTKLRQVSSGGVYGLNGADERTVIALHDEKIKALYDLVEEQEGQPLLVAVAFQHEVDAIRAALADLGLKDVPYLGGGISAGKSNQIVDEWNAGSIPVLLAHPTSVAHGLNLQSGGNAVCWFSLTWNLEEFDQFNARVWRQGQTKPVTFHYIVAVDTIDDDVLNALHSKARGQNALMNALKEKRL